MSSPAFCERTGPSACDTTSFITKQKNTSRAERRGVSVYLSITVLSESHSLSFDNDFVVQPHLLGYMILMQYIRLKEDNKQTQVNTCWLKFKTGHLNTDKPV